MPIPAVIAASIIGGGAGIGASLIAKNGQQNIANQQQAQSQQLLDRSAPAYTSAQNYYQGLLNNPMAQPGITNTQLQFNQAKNNLINSSTSRGGGLDAGLSNLEAGKAATISQLLAGGQQTGAAGLAQLATGQSSQGLAGLAGAQASNTQNTVLQQQALTGVGSFLTRLLAGSSQNSGGGNGYNGVNMDQAPSTVYIPAAVVPKTGQMYPGATSSYFPNY